MGELFNTSRGTKLKQMLPFYVAMILLASIVVWWIHAQWTAQQFEPVYEQAVLTGFGSDGRMGPAIWAETNDGRTHRLNVAKSNIDNCQVGGSIKLERRGDSLSVADIACEQG